MESREYDATNVHPFSGFEPAPEGFYDVMVRNVTEKISKNNDPLYNVEFEIQGGAYMGKRAWHNVTLLTWDDGTGKPAKGAGMAIHFLKCLGEPWEGKIRVTPDNWVGKMLRVKMGVEMDQLGRARNTVKEVLVFTGLDTHPVNDSKPRLNAQGVPF